MCFSKGNFKSNHLWMSHFQWKTGIGFSCSLMNSARTAHIPSCTAQSSSLPPLRAEDRGSASFQVIAAQSRSLGKQSSEGGLVGKQRHLAGKQRYCNNHDPKNLITTQTCQNMGGKQSRLVSRCVFSKDRFTDRSSSSRFTAPHAWTVRSCE